MSNICCHRHRHPVAIPATRGNAAFLYCLLQQPAHPARLPEHRLMPPTHATQRSMERETGIEPAQSAWKAEVLPLNYSRPDGTEQRNLCWWREVDSNHRRRKPADLQSAPVGRLGIPPAKSPLFSRALRRKSMPVMKRDEAGTRDSDSEKPEQQRKGSSSSP